MTDSTDPPRVSNSEPADPRRVDHVARREVRIAPPDIGVTNLPKAFIECGCGSCPDVVDPLAGDDSVFRDLRSAREECSEPQPVTMERAREAYLRYQKAAENGGEFPSLLQRTRAQHGKLMDAERQVLDEMGDPTLLFLSLRLSPIEHDNDNRYWVHPTRLDERLQDAWEPVKRKLRRRLAGFDFEYAAITSVTTSAATPHKHVLIYVDDPDNEVGIEVAQSAVESHVNNCKGAYEDDHRVEKGNSDAGIVFYNPPVAEKVPEETLLNILRYHDGDGFPSNTVPMLYIANQRPHWVIANVYDGTSDIDADDVLVDGGAVAWAAQYDWFSSSRGFSLSE